MNALLQVTDQLTELEQTPGGTTSERTSRFRITNHIPKGNSKLIGRISAATLVPALRKCRRAPGTVWCRWVAGQLDPTGRAGLPARIRSRGPWEVLQWGSCWVSCMPIGELAGACQHRRGEMNTAGRCAVGGGPSGGLFTPQARIQPRREAGHRGLALAQWPWTHP